MIQGFLWEQKLPGFGGREVVRNVREGFLQEVTTDPSETSLNGGF